MRTRRRRASVRTPRIRSRSRISHGPLPGAGRRWAAAVAAVPHRSPARACLADGPRESGPPGPMRRERPRSPSRPSALARPRAGPLELPDGAAQAMRELRDLRRPVEQDPRDHGDDQPVVNGIEHSLPRRRTQARTIWRSYWVTQLVPVVRTRGDKGRYAASTRIVSFPAATARSIATAASSPRHAAPRWSSWAAGRAPRWPRAGTRRSALEGVSSPRMSPAW